MQLAVFILLLFSLSAAAIGSIQYVKPDAPSSGNCSSHHPCYTLNQYIQESSKYFKTGSTFIFLPGNHSLRGSLNLTAVSELSFNGTENGPESIIICNDEVTMNNITKLNIEGIVFVLHLFQQDEKISSAFVFTNSQEVVIANSVFQKGSIHPPGRAIVATDSNITIIKCLFEGNTGDDGGAISARHNTIMTLDGSTFIGNQAIGRGGAVFSQQSTIILRGNPMNNFSHNSGDISGGAIYCIKSLIMTMIHNTFEHNFLRGKINTTGGAIGITVSNITAEGSINFSNNKAFIGGAISLNHSMAEFREGSFTFKENVADYIGGGMYANFSLITGMGNFTFTSNAAKGLGRSQPCGVMCFYVTYNSTQSSLKSKLSGINLTNNSGTSGGGLFIEKIEGSIIVNNIYARNNSDGALGILLANVSVTGRNHFIQNSHLTSGVLTIDQSFVIFSGKDNVLDSNDGSAIMVTGHSTVNFFGNTSISNNIAALGEGGGGINATQSLVTFNDETLFSNNSGCMGGAVYVERGKLQFNGQMSFINNSATKYGGALFASVSKIIVSDSKVINFSLNSAKRGGAMYLKSSTTMALGWYTKLNTVHNAVTEYGGAIFHEDVINIIQCRNVTSIIGKNTTIPYSFLQFIENETFAYLQACPRINSYNDFAGIDGNFLYGGLLDRSRFWDQDLSESLPYNYFTSYCSINVLPQNNETNDITSEPFQLSPCKGDEDIFQTNISVYKGQTFRLCIVALGQGNSRVPTAVTALTSPNARLNLNQSSQFIHRDGSEVIYNLYSTKTYEKVTIFPKGPCQTMGQASTVLNVTFKPCPDAFIQSNEECVCENRLKQLDATCVIEDGVSIWRYAGIRFWMSALYTENGSYGGLILYPSCPAEYCRADTVNISLENPDIQCAFNRGGVLCGYCLGNKSVLLGGPRCDVCSNLYLLLILPFAVAGIVLVVFLTLLRLTVATGTINSLILYANIVQVNKAVFFSTNRTNVLTIFIAWMNLDLGLETCFFNGMDAYAQTWLQFVFPVYVWILISLIILSSRYSITVSKLIGSNPVAVLATLLLMSYNKILKVIIDVFSSVKLEYPDRKLVSFWLKDGNLHYLQSKHLHLSIFTFLVLLFIFLPYTIFLLLGHLLYRLPYRKYYHWFLIRIKPLLDSYYAPYKRKTRSWAGFLLLIRCALYVVFSYNSLGGAKYSLLAIIVAFTAVGSITWLMKGIYHHFYVDIIEVSMYTNLIILAATTAILSGASKEIVTYVLVGIVFAVTIGIVLHQIHVCYFAKSALWFRIKSKMPCYQKNPNTPTDIDMPAPKTPKPVEVTKTVVDLREPLLDN